MDRNQRPGNCSTGPRIWKPDLRTQDLGLETQDPQSRTDDLELMIEDLGPRIHPSHLRLDICDHGLAFRLPTIWTFFDGNTH